MRRRKPLFAALIDAAAKVMNFFAAGQDRRAPRRLPRDFAKALNMNAMWSEARVKVSHRLAMHLHVDRFRLRNATPMVSFTFDDLPKSAVTTGADLLEAHGARGTFYVSGGLVGVGTPEWDGRRCQRRAGAASPRPRDRLPYLLAPARLRPRRGLARRRDRAQPRTISARSIPAIEIETFAYPFGYGSFARKQQLKSDIPDLPQHRAGRQLRQRRSAVPARHAADRPPDGPRPASTARSTRPKPITDG